MLLRWNAQSPELLIARASETMPFWVSLALVIVVGYFAARLVWLLVPLPAQPAWTPPPFAGIPTPAGERGADQSAYAAITNAHLFGEPSPADASAADAQNAPETQLNLQLRGAIAAIDERYVHAIVADASGIEKVYFLKDTLPGGAVLQQVQADRIILSRGGVLEALLLPKESTGGGVDQAGTRSSSQVQPLARRNRGQSPSMQDIVAQNANSITEVIRPQPYMPNGELKGYRIYPGRNRDQFVALGLQAGDLVTEINGMALNNPAQAMEMFKALADTTQVTVTIEREGRAQTLTLDTTQVATATGAVPDATNPAAAPPGAPTPGAPNPATVPAGSVPPGGATIQ
jgi:general secretion pathway protein C